MRGFFNALVAFALLCGGVAYGQAYPSKPVRIMVGYVPGGGVDTTARLVAAALSEAWGANVLVENRPGAAGNIATEATARAAPDGHTLVLCNIGSHSVTPARFRKKLTYDPIGDFAFPARIGGVPNVFMVHPSMPTRNLKEFVAYAKANPGKVNFGSSGVGASPHSFDGALQDDRRHRHRPRSLQGSGAGACRGHERTYGVLGG
ncbi:MAG TPA: tripartite tricarboxylate transporter substrate-binding protein [Burkholderiales bacterium]|nr:tripartite tricarboxylate transporter substrate-binding protein [Burkholderiales bacterium]